MQDIKTLIEAAGSPLALAALWDRETRQLISKLTETTVAQASAQGLEEGAAVVETVLGLYAHAFYVGRDHALGGLILPASAKRGLTGLTAQNIGSIIIPDDISSL